MMTSYFEGGWERAPEFRGYRFFRAGDYPDGIQLEPTYELRDMEIRQLITEIQKTEQMQLYFGLKPIPSSEQELREPDLKIIHRLLDVIDKGIIS